MQRKDGPMSEQPEPSSVRVRIYDREFALRTTGDPERLQALCRSLDTRMREVAASTGAVDTLKVAVRRLSASGMTCSESGKS